MLSNKVLPLYFVLIVYIIGEVNAIITKLKFMAFSFSLGDTFYKNITDEFNNYCKKNNLNIELSCELYNNSNATLKTEDIATTFDYLTKDKEFELFTYDTVYASRFKNKFYTLDYQVKKEIIDLYKQGSVLNTCIFDNKLYSLPLYVDYGVLVANDGLISKYGRKSNPQTWDELLETAIYVRDQEFLERTANLTDTSNEQKLPGYYARVADSEDGTCALLEVIHSFRDNYDSPFPSYTSENTKNAIKKLKEILKTVSSEDVFKLDNINNIFDKYIKSGKFIFARAWDSFGDLSFVKREKLPGHVKGISASCIGGVNLAINKSISKEKIDAAITAIEFFNSKEMQYRLITEYHKHSAIVSLYNKINYPRVCEIYNCDVFGSMQGIVRPRSNDNYDLYSKRFRDYIFEYLYEDDATDEDLNLILQDVMKIQRVYEFELHSIPGITLLSITFVILSCIIFSYIFICIMRFRKQFIFLPFNYWCICLTGLFLIACYSFTGFESLTIYHCKIRPFLISIGFTFLVVPFFLKTIVHFPNKNIYSKIVKDHFSLIFIIFILIDIVFSIIWFWFGNVNIEIIYSSTRGKESFRRCDFNSTSDTVFKTLMFSYKLLILICMALLLFTEWNLRSIKYDIRSITSSVYIEVFGLSIFMFLTFFSFNDRYLDFGIKALLIELVVFSVLILIVGRKVYDITMNSEEDEFSSSYFSSSNKFSSERYKTTNKYIKSGSSNSNSNNSRVGNFMSYHFQTEKNEPSYMYSVSGAGKFSSNNSYSNFNYSTTSNHLFANTISEYNETMNNLASYNNFNTNKTSIKNINKTQINNNTMNNSKYNQSPISNISNSYSSNIKPSCDLY